MSVPPISPLVVGAHGAWRELRRTAADGSCGVHGYPCLHPGVDVAGPAGTKVHAPEAGVVVIAADGSAPPFVGYGPWLVLIRGTSGRYHLLGHLDPRTAPLAPTGAHVTEGQLIGTTSSANHTHWEVRTKPTPGAGRTNLDNNTDPIAWLHSGKSWLALTLIGAGGYLLYRVSRRRS